MRTQAEHDAAHPGKVCQHCPVTLRQQRLIAERIARIQAPWWRRWLTRRA